MESRGVSKSLHQGSKLKAADRISSPTKKRNTAFLDLRNDPSKFQFAEKNEHTQQLNSGGLSLLERIRLKEKRLCESKKTQVTPQEQYQKFLKEKATTIYDIIYQSHNTRAQGREISSHSLKKMAQSIRDSSEYPVSEKEASDVVKLIALKLPAKVLVITKGELSVVKIHDLDRDLDMKTLSDVANPGGGISDTSNMI